MPKNIATMIIALANDYRMQSGIAGPYAVMAHPSMAKTIIRDHVVAECREAGHDILFVYRQDVAPETLCMSRRHCEL